MVCDKELSQTVLAGRSMLKAAEDDIVISGMAGNFPDSDGLTELAHGLFNKVDLISDDDRRWKLDHPEIPQRTGKLKNVNKFDASSFGIHYNQAQCMDPMCRVLLEKAYEAIVDAGVNPYTLKGSKTGVFVGACFSESEKTWFYEKLQMDGFGVTGCVRTMMANRISYTFGFDGPSYIVDTACSSSMYAFEQGYNAIRQGLCDAALVGGCNLCLHPYVSLQFARLGVLSLDGRCKVFDESANGYCRSETIAALFLQKKKDSRRIYATVVHVKTNCDGYKEQGITYPSGEMQQQLLEEFYEECEIDPSTVSWIEAHGTGTKVGDPEEVRALYNVFCKNRNTPLKVGSVKSNLGHTEPSSGLCSIAKVLIAMETGTIPPNINFKTPRADISYFHTGELQVVTEPTPWEGGTVGVNSFGFGGANCHALLKWNEKVKKNGGLPDDDIPRLVNISGRTVEAVDTILSFLENSSLDVELVKLLHDIHKDVLPSHLYRGYTILTKNKTIKKREIEDFGMKKSLILEFSGVCNKWKSFDKTLFLNFPVFSQTLSKLSSAIPLDIQQLISKPENTLSNPVDFLVSIVASQIALYDLLQHIGIKADGFLGLSIGNLVCAYADGCLSAEEAIVIAYNLGLVLEKESANLGNKKSNMQSDSDKKKDAWNLSHALLMSLKPKVMDVLKKVVKNRATSTSAKWLNANGNKSTLSADFIFQNIVSSFSQDDDDFTEDCMVVRVGSKGIYEHFDFPRIEVLDREGIDDTTSLLTSLGKIFMGGIDYDASKLYKPVEYPVSRSTAMIAPLIRWDHTIDWFVTSYRLQKKIGSGERTVTISLEEEETEFISGHIVDGRNLFPATGYLSIVWETFALLKGDHCTEVPIVFEDVRFLRATNITKDGTVDFTVVVQRASGKFEVIEGGAPIVTGRAYIPDDASKEMSSFDAPVTCNKELNMSSKDIYKELRLRGYHYKGLFRSLIGANVEECVGVVRWQRNWIAFMDNMLQMQILHNDTRGLFVPTAIDKVVIDGRKHVQAILTLPEDDEKDLAVYYYKDAQLIKCGGVEVRGLKANAISRKKVLAEEILEKYLFIPNYTDSQVYCLEDIIRVYMQIILENEQTISVKAVEVYDKEHPIIAPLMAQSLSDLPLIQPNIVIFGTPEISEDDPLPPEVTVEDKKLNNDQTALIVAANNVLRSEHTSLVENCLNAIKPGGYLIVRQSSDVELKNDNLIVLCSHVFNNERVILLKNKKQTDIEPTTEVYYTSHEDCSWIAPSQTALKTKEVKRVVFVGRNESENGTLGFVNCVRKEPDGQKARCVIIMDHNAPQFSLEERFYRNQLSKDLANNVYKDGQWGTYRHLKLDSKSKVKAAHITANTLVRGDLSSLSWIRGNIPEQRCFDPNDDELIHITYTSLNFRDIMLASGKLAPEVIAANRKQQLSVIGFEFSGVDKKGQKYMGLRSTGALASITTKSDSIYWPVPEGWTLEEAATVPVVYSTVLYAMILRGRLRRNDSVLIHAGSGGVGQAAINIALATGCEVFTTVGTPEKRKFIKETFPQIDDRHIGNSRDTSFEQLIMSETNGRGVDVVLNSLAEEKLLASARCLAKGGRFLEIGKFDLANNNPLGMEIFAKGASFHGILLDSFMDGKFEAKNVIHSVVEKYLAEKWIKPICRHVFDKDDIETAFRFMASGKHIGKVLLKVADPESYSIPLVPRLFDAIPRYFCAPGKTYVILGGLGGFGLELADWLSLRGASNIVLTSRKGVVNGYQRYRINLWESYGVNVCVLTDDITTYEGVENILKVSSSLGPVAGIFNLAVVLKDAIYENQTEASFKESLGPKAVATKYLDILSRKLCPELEQFVIFSSVSCGRGNAGQTNYGMSNSIMERICESRVAQGLPGIAIQWGAVGDVGLVAEMMDDNIEMVIGGTLQQRITSCLEVMDQFLFLPHPVVASMVVAEKKSGHGSSDSIVDTVVNILGIRDLKTVSLHSNLAELGMDSMMAVEIKQTLEREFEVFLSPQDIRGLTLAKLQDYAANKDAPEEKTTEAIKEDEVTLTTPGFEEFIFQLIDKEPGSYIPVVKMDTLKSDKSKKILMIPGLEGFPVVFETLAKQLNFETYGLQLDYTTYYDNVCNAVDKYLEDVIPYIGDKTFNIVGYSYGGLIALELVRRLELLGYNGKLILIDSTPDCMLSFTKFNFADTIGDSLEIKLLLCILDNVLLPSKKIEIEQILQEASDWNSRIDLVTTFAKRYSSLSDTFMKQWFSSVFSRMLAIYKYSLPEKCISSPVALIWPSRSLVLPDVEDGGLSQYCKSQISIHSMEGNHLTVLSNVELAEFINDTVSGKEAVRSKPVLHPTTNISLPSDPAKQI